MNPKAVSMAPDFELECLLQMDKAYYEEKIWPHMFDISSDDIWR